MSNIWGRFPAWVPALPFHQLSEMMAINQLPRSRIQPILLFSWFFLECETVYLGYSAVLHLWQFIITPINMSAGDPKNKTEGCRKREELAQSLWARCIQLSSRSYSSTFESAHAAPSDQENCSCRTGARFSCELFGSPGKVDAVSWACSELPIIWMSEANHSQAYWCWQ